MKRNLTKKERVKRKEDFKRIFQSSLKVNCLGAKLSWASNDLPFSRLGISLTKKFGNAVERNRAKRQMRELFRTNKAFLKESFDFLFVLFPGEFSYGDRTKQFFTLIRKAALAKEVRDSGAGDHS